MQANVEVAATPGNRTNAALAPGTAAIGVTAGITGTSVAKASAAPVPNGCNFPTSPSIPKSILPRRGKDHGRILSREAQPGPDHKRLLQYQSRRRPRMVFAGRTSVMV